MKKALLTAVLILLIVFPALYADEVRVVFAKNRSESPMLPVDSVIGQLADENSDASVYSLALALREEYSFEWTETHIAEQYRSSLVKLFGTWFSENLPVSEALFSAPYLNNDGTVGVNVRFGTSCMTFLLDGNQIVSMRLL